MDEIDRRIVAALQRDGRRTLAGLSAAVGLSAPPLARRIARLEARLRQFEEVMECYLMTGTREVLIRVVAADLPSLDRFLENGLMQIPGIRAMRTSFALRSMIRRDALPEA